MELYHRHICYMLYMLRIYKYSGAPNENFSNSKGSYSLGTEVSILVWTFSV